MARRNSTCASERRRCGNYGGCCWSWRRWTRRWPAAAAARKLLEEMRMFIGAVEAQAHLRLERRDWTLALENPGNWRVRRWPRRLRVAVLGLERVDFDRHYGRDAPRTTEDRKPSGSAGRSRPPRCTICLAGCIQRRSARPSRPGASALGAAAAAQGSSALWRGGAGGGRDPRRPGG